MDLRFSFFLIGIAYAAIPLTVWYILRTRTCGASARYWCVGNGLFAVTLLLMGARSFVPEWVGYSVASAVAYLSYSLRHASIQLEAGDAPSSVHRALHVALVLGAAGFWIDGAVGYQRNSVLINSAIQMVFSVAIAWQAYRIYKSDDHKDFLLVFVGYVLMAAALGFRLMVLDLDISRTGVANHESSIFIVFIAALACVILGNIGFVGHALRRYELLLKTNEAKLVQEKERRAAVEQAVAEKQKLLDELSVLMSQREIVTQNLVAEVLKPMQRMSGSLEHFTASLRQRGDADALLPMVRRLETFLRRVSTTASNAVTHARYLPDKSEVFRQEIEINLINDLILADLSFNERSRIDTVVDVCSQTVRLDFELFRIALLNLVSRALCHGDCYNRIEIRIEETDNPAALAWNISSLPEDAAGKPEPTLSGTPEKVPLSKILQPADDLACQVAHRAIALHNGELFKDESADGIRFLVRIPFE